MKEIKQAGNLVGACRSCNWARTKIENAVLVGYDGSNHGWCGKDGQTYEFWNHREPDMSKPVNECWQAIDLV